jgi:hypothetical protein
VEEDGIAQLVAVRTVVPLFQERRVVAAKPRVGANESTSAR